jgi:hypothetical protein
MSDHSSGPSALSSLEPELRTRLLGLCHEGWEIWDHFSRSRDVDDFHPFIAAEYEVVLEALVPFRSPGLKFLEWGSATGVITILADLLGFDAYGIELEGDLVIQARDLAKRYGSGATFARGSFIPQGYRWNPPDGDGRTATIGHGPSGYLELGLPLEEFDLVFAYPWGGEEPLILDLMSSYGRDDALLLLNTVNRGVQVYRGGKVLEAPPGGPSGSRRPTPQEPG